MKQFAKKWAESIRKKISMAPSWISYIFYTILVIGLIALCIYQIVAEPQVLQSLIGFLGILFIARDKNINFPLSSQKNSGYTDKILFKN